jgi:hypothetical protein
MVVTTGQKPLIAVYENNTLISSKGYQYWLTLRDTSVCGCIHVVLCPTVLTGPRDSVARVESFILGCIPPTALLLGVTSWRIGRGPRKIW